MSARRATMMGITLVVGMCVLGSLFINYVIPAIIMKYGHREDASEKFVFEIDSSKRTTVEFALRKFSTGNGLSFKVLHWPSRGRFAMDVRMSSEAIGEITVNNGADENVFVCYFYQREKSPIPEVILDRFKSLFLSLGATTLEEKNLK